jgi:Na+-driven multidrug efflux pump
MQALAGVALVFPVLMLTQMTSSGGIGGGVSSAVARAVGAGRRQDAEALVWHAIIVAFAFDLIFTAAVLYDLVSTYLLIRYLGLPEVPYV